MPKQSKADLKEAEREKLRIALLKEIGSETPFPDGPDDLKNKSSKWENVDFTNVHKIKKIIPTLTLEDVPTSRTFQEDGGKGGRSQVATYVRFLIEEQATQKRKATTHLDREEKKKRGACDLALPGLAQSAREDAWRSALLDPSNLDKLKIEQDAFVERTGGVGQKFWRRLNQERRDMKTAKAKADGKVRVMTRKIALPDAWQPGQQGDGAMPFGDGVEEMSGPWSIGDEASDYVRSVVEEAAKRRGVSLEDMGADWARVLLKIARALEMKLRRVGMTTNARCVTTALTTGRDFTVLGVRAAERALVRLVAELREAPTDAPDVVVLRDWNRCDVRECLTTCGDAPSIGFGAVALEKEFGESIEELADALGCDVEELRADLASKAAAAATPAPLAIQDQTTTAGGVLGGGAASRGGLPSGRLGDAYRRAAAVSDEAPASLGDAVKGYDWERRVLDRASRLRSAPREPLVTAMTDTNSAEVPLDPRSPTFLADYVRLVSPNLDNVPLMDAALNKLELHETPGGEGGLCLLDWGLMAFDPLTGKGVAGPFIKMCEDIDEELRPKGSGHYAKGKFYAPKILHLALQKAILSGKLHFERDMLTLFYCIFGKLFFALLFYAGRITMLKAQAMGFDPTLVPLELPCEDLPMVEPSIAKRFPKGIVIEKSGDLYEILSATNNSFFDEGKCVLWALAFAAYYGVGHPRARAALAAVAACKDDHERAASRVAACHDAIDALATGGGAGVSAVGAGACGDVLAVADGAPAPAPYVPFPSLKAACDAAVTQCEFEIRFAFPARKRDAPRMTKWYKVDDLVPVCAALSSSHPDWNSVRSNHSWVFESSSTAPWRTPRARPPRCSPARASRRSPRRNRSSLCSIRRASASTTRPTRSGRASTSTS